MSHKIFKIYKGAGIALFKKTDNIAYVLLGKRKYNPYRNTWSILGGAQERNETLEKTAFREFSEETGTNIDDSLILWKKEKKIRLPFFRWKTVLIETTQEINLNQEFYTQEFFELKWVDLKNIKEYKLHPFVKTVVKLYMKGLKYDNR